jgi:hypothetical protein
MQTQAEIKNCQSFWGCSLVDNSYVRQYYLLWFGGFPLPEYMTTGS